MIHEAKSEVQKEAYKAWSSNNYIGAISMVTGTGKSRIGVFAAKAVQNAGKKVLLITPRQNLRDEEWKSEFTKWEVDYCGVTFECIQTAHKRKYDTNLYDLVIVDEADICLGEKFINLFKNNKFNKILMLSATYSDKILKKLEEINVPVVYKVDYDVALEKGLITNFKIFNVAVELEPGLRVAYTAVQNAMKIIEIEMNKIYGVEKKNVYAYCSNALKNMNTSGYLRATSAKYLSLVNKRKEIIYKSEAKLPIIKAILDGQNKDRKCIIFSERIEQSNKIISLLNKRDRRCYEYNSKAKADENKKVMELFRKSKRGIISAVNCLNRGVNVPDCDMIIINSGTSTKADFIQRLGRAVRLAEQQDKIAICFQIYIKDTQDFYWTLNRTKDVPITKVFEGNYVLEKVYGNTTTTKK